LDSFAVLPLGSKNCCSWPGKKRTDELAAEIRSVLNEREFLRNRLGITRQPEKG
jgi:hypothetical protein